MDSENVIAHDTAECAKCKEHANDVEIYGAFALGLAFIGPIIGILIGLFVGKKLLNK